MFDLYMIELAIALKYIFLAIAFLSSAFFISFILTDCKQKLLDRDFFIFIIVFWLLFLLLPSIEQLEFMRKNHIKSVESINQNEYRIN